MTTNRLYMFPATGLHKWARLPYSCGDPTGGPTPTDCAALMWGNAYNEDSYEPWGCFTANPFVDSVTIAWTFSSVLREYTMVGEGIEGGVNWLSAADINTGMASTNFYQKISAPNLNFSTPWTVDVWPMLSGLGFAYSGLRSTTSGLNPYPQQYETLWNSLGTWATLVDSLKTSIVGYAAASGDAKIVTYIASKTASLDAYKAWLLAKKASFSKTTQYDKAKTFYDDLHVLQRRLWLAKAGVEPVATVLSAMDARFKSYATELKSQATFLADTYGEVRSRAWASVGDIGGVFFDSKNYQSILTAVKNFLQTGGSQLSSGHLEGLSTGNAGNGGVAELLSDAQVLDDAFGTAGIDKLKLSTDGAPGLTFITTPVYVAGPHYNFFVSFGKAFADADVSASYDVQLRTNGDLRNPFSATTFLRYDSWMTAKEMDCGCYGLGSSDPGVALFCKCPVPNAYKATFAGSSNVSKKYYLILYSTEPWMPDYPLGIIGILTLTTVPDARCITRTASTPYDYHLGAARWTWERWTYDCSHPIDPTTGPWGGLGTYLGTETYDTPMWGSCYLWATTSDMTFKSWMRFDFVYSDKDGNRVNTLFEYSYTATDIVSRSSSQAGWNCNRSWNAAWDGSDPTDVWVYAYPAVHLNGNATCDACCGGDFSDIDDEDPLDCANPPTFADDYDWTKIKSVTAFSFSIHDAPSVLRVPDISNPDHRSWFVPPDEDIVWVNDDIVGLTGKKVVDGNALGSVKVLFYGGSGVNRFMDGAQTLSLMNIAIGTTTYLGDPCVIIYGTAYGDVNQYLLFRAKIPDEFTSEVTLANELTTSDDYVVALGGEVHLHVCPHAMLGLASPCTSHSVRAYTPMTTTYPRELPTDWRFGLPQKTVRLADTTTLALLGSQAWYEEDEWAFSGTEAIVPYIYFDGATQANIWSNTVGTWSKRRRWCAEVVMPPTPLPLQFLPAGGISSILYWSYNSFVDPSTIVGMKELVLTAQSNTGSTLTLRSDAPCVSTTGCYGTLVGDGTGYWYMPVSGPLVIGPSFTTATGESRAVSCVASCTLFCIGDGSVKDTIDSGSIKCSFVRDTYSDPGSAPGPPFYYPTFIDGALPSVVAAVLGSPTAYPFTAYIQFDTAAAYAGNYLGGFTYTSFPAPDGYAIPSSYTSTKYFPCSYDNFVLTSSLSSSTWGANSGINAYLKPGIADSAGELPEKDLWAYMYMRSGAYVPSVPGYTSPDPIAAESSGGLVFIGSSTLSVPTTSISNSITPANYQTYVMQMRQNILRIFPGGNIYLDPYSTYYHPAFSLDVGAMMPPSSGSLPSVSVSLLQSRSDTRDTMEVDSAASAYNRDFNALFTAQEFQTLTGTYPLGYGDVSYLKENYSDLYAAGKNQALHGYPISYVSPYDSSQTYTGPNAGPFTVSHEALTFHLFRPVELTDHQIVACVRDIDGDKVMSLGGLRAVSGIKIVKSGGTSDGFRGIYFNGDMFESYGGDYAASGQDYSPFLGGYVFTYGKAILAAMGVVPSWATYLNDAKLNPFIGYNDLSSNLVSVEGIEDGDVVEISGIFASDVFERRIIQLHTGISQIPATLVSYNTYPYTGDPILNPVTPYSSQYLSKNDGYGYKSIHYVEECVFKLCPHIGYTWSSRRDNDDNILFDTNFEYHWRMSQIHTDARAIRRRWMVTYPGKTPLIQHNDPTKKQPLCFTVDRRGIVLAYMSCDEGVTSEVLVAKDDIEDQKWFSACLTLCQRTNYTVDQLWPEMNGALFDISDYVNIKVKDKDKVPYERTFASAILQMRVGVGVGIPRLDLLRMSIPEESVSWKFAEPVGSDLRLAGLESAEFHPSYEGPKDFATAYSTDDDRARDIGFARAERSGGTSGHYWLEKDTSTVKRQIGLRYLQLPYSSSVRGYFETMSPVREYFDEDITTPGNAAKGYARELMSFDCPDSTLFDCFERENFRANNPIEHCGASWLGRGAWGSYLNWETCWPPTEWSCGGLDSARGTRSDNALVVSPDFTWGGWGTHSVYGKDFGAYPWQGWVAADDLSESDYWKATGTGLTYYGCQTIYESYWFQAAFMLASLRMRSVLSQYMVDWKQSCAYVEDIAEAIADSFTYGMPNFDNVDQESLVPLYPYPSRPKWEYAFAYHHVVLDHVANQVLMATYGCAKTSYDAPSGTYDSDFKTEVLSLTLTQDIYGTQQYTEFYGGLDSEITSNTLKTNAEVAFALPTLADAGHSLRVAYGSNNRVPGFMYAVGVEIGLTSTTSKSIIFVGSGKIAVAHLVVEGDLKNEVEAVTAAGNGEVRVAFRVPVSEFGRLLVLGGGVGSSIRVEAMDLASFLLSSRDSRGGMRDSEKGFVPNTSSGKPYYTVPGYGWTDGRVDSSPWTVGKMGIGGDKDWSGWQDLQPASEAAICIDNKERHFVFSIDGGNISVHYSYNNGNTWVKVKDGILFQTQLARVSNLRVASLPYSDTLYVFYFLDGTYYCCKSVLAKWLVDSSVMDMAQYTEAKKQQQAGATTAISLGALLFEKPAIVLTSSKGACTGYNGSSFLPVVAGSSTNGDRFFESVDGAYRDVFYARPYESRFFQPSPLVDRKGMLRLIAFAPLPYSGLGGEWSFLRAPDKMSWKATCAACDFHGTYGRQRSRKTSSMSLISLPKANSDYATQYANTYRLQMSGVLAMPSQMASYCPDLYFPTASNIAYHSKSGNVVVFMQFGNYFVVREFVDGVLWSVESLEESDNFGGRITGDAIEDHDKATQLDRALSSLDSPDWLGNYIAWVREYLATGWPYTRVTTTWPTGFGQAKYVSNAVPFFRPCAWYDQAGRMQVCFFNSTTGIESFRLRLFNMSIYPPTEAVP